MSMINNIYKDLAEKNEKQNQGIDIISIQFDNKKIIELLEGSKLLGYQNKKTKIGEADGVYMLKDGRILEKTINHGWLYSAYVFKNESDWNKYKEGYTLEQYLEMF